MPLRRLFLPGFALLGVACGRPIELSELGDEREQIPADEIGCAAPVDYAMCMAGEDEPLLALGLACSDDPNEAIVPVEPSSLAAGDPDSWRVASYFGGPSWRPRSDRDDRLLLLTTGRLPPARDDAGVMAPPASQQNEGPNHNPDGVPLPPPIDRELVAAGLLFDQISLSTALEVPAGTRSLGLELALFSAEFPEFVGSPFGDLFMIWSTSEAFTGNVATIDGGVLTATALADAGWMRHVGDDPALAGTGFEGNGASGWLRMRAPVVPGERVELVMVLADVGDAEVATAVLLDDLSWSCDACRFGAGEHDQACGLSLE